MDNVIADFEGGFLANWKNKYHDLLWVKLEDRKSFFIKDDYPAELTPQIESIYFSEGFFLNLEPIVGAIETLKEMESLGYLVKISTTPLES